MRPIDVKYHFIRDALSEGRINVEYCPTEDMVADILTKPVSKVKIVKFKRFLFGNEGLKFFVSIPIGLCNASFQ